MVLVNKVAPHALPVNITNDDLLPRIPCFCCSGSVNALRCLDRRNDIRPQVPLLLVGVVTAYKAREDIELELEPAMRVRAEARLGLDAVFIDDAEAANWP